MPLPRGTVAHFWIHATPPVLKLTGAMIYATRHAPRPLPWQSSPSCVTSGLDASLDVQTLGL